MKALPESSSRIVGWLDDQLKKLDEGTSIRLALRHIGGAKASVVNRWTATRTNNANELAVEIAQAAQVDAHFMGGGGKRYELIAIVGGENVGRYGLRVEDVEQDDDEGPNGRYQLTDAAVALVKQSHDHVNGLVRAMVTLALGSEKTRLAELARLGERIEAMENKLDKARETVEQAQEKQFEREMKREQVKNQERRLDEAFATGRVMLPFAINAVAKTNLVPTGDNSILKEALKPVMSGLTEGQLAKIQEVLTPAQMVGLLEVWKLLNSEGNANGTVTNGQDTSKIRPSM
jgi:hypothetical protein